MKQIFRILFTACLLLSLPRHAFGFVYENPDEFQATGDFDGDGRLDILIVDRPTGAYRVGYQLSAGAFTWAPMRTGGIEGVTGVAVGRLFDTGRDALALTAPNANRVNLFDASSTVLAGTPVSVFTGVVGPNLVAALDVGGAGDTAHHDLLIGSLWNSAPAANQLTRVRNNGLTQVELAPSLTLAQPPARGNRVTVKTGVPDMLGIILRNPAGNSFVAYNLADGSPVNVASVAGLPLNVDYVHAPFAAGSSLNQFVFYQPGQNTLRVHPILEPALGTFAFGAASSHDLGLPIRQVFALADTTNTKLLVLFGDGQTAGVYGFDGASAPASLDSFASSAGEVFTGAAPVGGGGFTMLSGNPADGRSRSFQQWTFNGSDYTAGPSGTLPAVNDLSGTANVLFFQQEPLVSAVPNLLGSRRAGDWSSLFGLNPNQVTAESFAGSAAGLDNPTVAALGALPALTQFGLVNQSPFGPMSMFSFIPPIGEEVLEVTIQPAPGLYHQSVALTLALTTPNPANPIFYRTSPANPWTPYLPGTTIPLFKDTTVSYYAQLGAGPKKTVVRHATFEFPVAPEHMDSDGDGVPDFVEIANNLDPTAGNDSDGDFFSDLCELLSGTTPGNPASFPAAPCAQESSPAQLVVGLTFQRQPAQSFPSLPGTQLRVYDLQGSLLEAATTLNLGVPGATDPAGAFKLTAHPQQRMAVVATDPHFDLSVPDPDKKVGRELLGLVDVPTLPGGVQVPYADGGGALAAEAAGWLAAAQVAFNQAASLTTVATLDIHDTLIALLVERKFEQLLLNRGFVSYSNLTFFPFRATDAARSNAPLALLLSLEKLNNGQPGFRLKDVFQTVHGALSAPAPGPLTHLRNVASEIYRISSLLNNGSPPGTYAPVVDVIRGFLISGQLPAAYAAATTLSQADLTSAFTGVANVLALVSGRPTATINLVVRPDSFIGPCTLLDPAGGGPARSLWHREGVPFNLLQAFALPAGSEIQVFGYTDLPNLGCAGDAVEVISLTLGTVPVPAPADSDDDLLADALELLLFGDLDQNGSGDSDGDGFSDLQEVLDGTDPNDPSSNGQTVVNLSPPALSLEILPGGLTKLTFQFPEAYADKIFFGILFTPALGSDFTESIVTPVHLGGGLLEAILPNTGEDAQFYLLYLGLK